MSFGMSAPAFCCTNDKAPAECRTLCGGLAVDAARDHLRRGVDPVCKMAVAGNYQTDHTRCPPEFMTLF